MTLTVTQNVASLTMTVTSNETSVVINPVVNSVSGESKYVTINGFDVLAAGKTDLLNFQVGDKFHGWDNDRFVRGKILSLPVTLPTDLDDKTKVGLVTNNTY